MAKTRATSGQNRSLVRPSNDIYTVLVSIGLAIVLAAIGFVIFRCTELFDTPFPGIKG